MKNEKSLYSLCPHADPIFVVAVVKKPLPMSGLVLLKSREESDSKHLRSFCKSFPFPEAVLSWYCKFLFIVQ